MTVHHLIDAYGYLAVFALVGLDSMGVPVPGETAILAAGVYAGTTHRLSPWAVFAVAAAAAVVGDNVGFWIGRVGGYRVARRFGRILRIDETTLKVGRYVFDRHGAMVVFLGRFVMLLRTYAALLAGTNAMTWRRFLVANAAGGVLWAATCTLASSMAGQLVARLPVPLDASLAAVVVAVTAVATLLLRARAGELTRRAEAAYPGPLPRP